LSQLQMTREDLVCHFRFVAHAPRRANGVPITPFADPSPRPERGRFAILAVRVDRRPGSCVRGPR
jgi:hypothetical protein